MQNLWIAAGAIFVLILLLIIGLIFIIPRLFSPTVSVVTPTPLPTLPPAPTSTPMPVDTPTPTPFPQGGGPGLTTKTLSGPGFTLAYPGDWSLLICNNSPNFEFDPNGGPDELGVTCGTATKPITVLVTNSPSSCLGESAILGGVEAVRSTTVTNNFTQHQWCTVTSPSLTITNRVSSASFPATSPIDYSSQIEELVISLNTGI